ncbi:MAG: WYL domain-containing transcriptional regulator [Thermodesulfobacteriota bacterium]|nr:WYL domain-containing transcriptional regulator [Thermodesulfobacteriota bacterium]
MRGDQLARQWRILRTIESRKHGATVADLAAEEDCHPRTIWRDLAAIQAAGFPLCSEKDGTKSRWGFVEGYKFHLPVPFTITELMSLYFYRDILQIFKNTVFYESLDELFRKIRATLPPESLSYLTRIEQTFHIGFKPFKDYSRFKEIIKQINEAVLKFRVVEMRYYSMSSKRETTRKVDPYKVWFFNGTLYLIGWCHVHDEVRMFVLDRIRLVHVTNQAFIPPDDFDLDEYMRGCFGVIHTDVEKITIRFDASLERYLRENLWHPSQVFKKDEDGNLLMTMEVGGLCEVMSWVLGFGRQAEILEPEHLRVAVAEELSITFNKYSQKDREILKRDTL